MKNWDIRDAMHLCFGPILDSWGNKCAVEGIIFLLLASIVHHSEFFLEQSSGTSGHPFLAIPILQQPELLESISLLVTVRMQSQNSAI